MTPVVTMKNARSIGVIIAIAMAVIQPTGCSCTALAETVAQRKLANIVMSCLSKDPADRPTPTEIVALLRKKQ